MIYHITSRSQWKQAQAQGHYAPPSLQDEGFIHACARDQLLKVANAFYQGQENLLILCIDESRLTSRWVREAPAHPNPETASQAPDSALFPHIYGILELEAVVAALPLPAAQNGFQLPDELPLA